MARLRLDLRPGWWMLPIVFALIVVITMLLAFVLFASWRMGETPRQAAPATSPCEAYGDIASALRAVGEAPVFSGLDDRGLLAEVWVGAGGEWTWLFVAADGQTCLAAAGTAAEPAGSAAEERQG